MKKILYLLILLVIVFSTIGCSGISRGVFKKKMLIQSQPTPAKIYVNGEYIGITPVTTKLWYEKEKFVNIKAEPFYESQTPQNIYIKIPPIPPKLTIFMDYQEKEKVDIMKKQQELMTKMELQDITEVEKEIVEIIKIIKEPTLIKLPEIYFETDKDELVEKQQDKLFDLIVILQDHPEYNLTIHAHADERGNPDYNRQLSYRRGLSVRTYLAGQVENSMRIMVHGEQVTFSESNEKLDYQLNRVVNFTLEFNEQEGK